VKGELLPGFLHHY
jgi:hypothetical protein